MTLACGPLFAISFNYNTELLKLYDRGACIPRAPRIHIER
jgi:hypothetical protein